MVLYDQVILPRTFNWAIQVPNPNASKKRIFYVANSLYIDLLDHNRVGILSCIGFYALYLIGNGIGRNYKLIIEVRQGKPSNP